MTPEKAAEPDKRTPPLVGGKVEKKPHWAFLYAPPVAVFIGAMFHHHIF